MAFNILDFILGLFKKKEPEQVSAENHTEISAVESSQNEETIKEQGEPEMNKPRILTRQEAVERYGQIEDGKWPNEAKWMTVYRVPSEISALMINSATGKPATKIYMNKDMVEPINNAFAELIKKNLANELKTFDGCFMIRDVRGVPGQMSWHSYGLAIDINAKDNGLGKEPKLSEDFVKCFTSAGFIWGGDFRRKDGMHFQLGEG